MFKIKAMIDKIQGYRVVKFVDTIEEAREFIKAYQVYHNPIDVYYTYAD